MGTTGKARRIAPVVTGDTPLEDVYGPPEELDAYVQILLDRGEDVDPTFIELVDQWRENNDMPSLAEERAKSGEK